ncbi:MAG: hypothetical protein AAF846_18115 [Chloroflexota bacterium]
MMIIGGLTAIMAGAFCFTNTDLAWWLYERDCQFWGQTVTRPTNWRQWVQSIGMSLIILGMMAIVLGINLL